jgi:hypothetical protein
VAQQRRADDGVRPRLDEYRADLVSIFDFRKRLLGNLNNMPNNNNNNNNNNNEREMRFVR